MKTSPASMIFLIVLLAALTIPSCARPQVERAPTITPTIAVVQDSTRTVEPKIEIMKKPLITHLYTADPSAHVFEGKLYIYPSHDLDHDAPPSQNGDQFDMEDYHVFSMENMHSLPVDHGQVLHVDDVPWAEKQMWAPDAAFKNDTYYLYFPAKAHDGNFHIGVATGKSPAGPFTPEPEFIPRSFSIDPCVFIDDDEQAYMYFGGLWGGQLEKWQTDNFDPEGEEPIATQPALGPRVAKLSADMLHFDGPATEISITDENGKPLIASDHARRFFEASWMHKYDGVYYLSYSTGDTHYLAYATGETPIGPFVFRGYILFPVLGWTTHHSIVEFQGRWYLFYHDATLSGGIDHKRSIKVTELVYNADGSIKTLEP
jgi:glycosyl hydrolase family 43